MTIAAQKATELLDALHLNHLLDTRAAVYASIEDLRDHARHEVEVMLPTLKAEIKRIGAALEDARSRGLNHGDVIYDELVRAIREVNHARAHNRQRIKELAEDQAINKAALAELNREISYFEAESLLDEVEKIITYH
ncbi:minor tail protein [Xanthomonas phage BUDD]|nr:minor tail protein [Xanthomonas phage BUDD]